MNDLIEQMAKAMAPPKFWGLMKPQLQQQYLDQAAAALDAIRGAGALIIVPDKKLVGRIAEVIYQQVELYGVTYDRVAQAVLDALRDAMPDTQEVEK